MISLSTPLTPEPPVDPKPTNEELKKQIQASIQITVTIGQTICALGSVPSGELHAQVMGKLSLESYSNVIEMLKKAKLVKESNHLLTWIGPKLT